MLVLSIFVRVNFDGKSVMSILSEMLLWCHYYMRARRTGKKIKPRPKAVILKIRLIQIIQMNTAPTVFLLEPIACLGCIPDTVFSPLLLLLLLQRSTAVQVRSSVWLMPQIQPSGRGLLPSPTAWSPNQHHAATLADVSRHIPPRWPSG